jgi:hypothetical protein
VIRSLGACQVGEVVRNVRDRQSRILTAARAVAKLANLTHESYISTKANLPCRAGKSSHYVSGNWIGCTSLESPCEPGLDELLLSLYVVMQFLFTLHRLPVALQLCRAAGVTCLCRLFAVLQPAGQGSRAGSGAGAFSRTWLDSLHPTYVCSCLLPLPKAESINALRPNSLSFDFPGPCNVAPPSFLPFPYFKPLPPSGGLRVSCDAVRFNLRV